MFYRLRIRILEFLLPKKELLVFADKGELNMHEQGLSAIFMTTIDRLRVEKWMDDNELQSAMVTICDDCNGLDLNIDTTSGVWFAFIT